MMKLEPVDFLPEPAKRQSKAPKHCLICEVELSGNRVITCGQVKCVAEVWRLAQQIREITRVESIDPPQEGWH